MSLLAGLVNIGLAVAAAYGFGAYLGLLFTPLMCAPPPPLHPCCSVRKIKADVDACVGRSRAGFRRRAGPPALGARTRPNVTTPLSTVPVCLPPSALSTPSAACASMCSVLWLRRPCRKRGIATMRVLPVLQRPSLWPCPFASLKPPSGTKAVG